MTLIETLRHEHHPKTDLSGRRWRKTTLRRTKLHRESEFYTLKLWQTKPRGILQKWYWYRLKQNRRWQWCNWQIFDISPSAMSPLPSSYLSSIVKRMVIWLIIEKCKLWTTYYPKWDPVFKEGFSELSTVRRVPIWSHPLKKQKKRLTVVICAGNSILLEGKRRILLR